MFAFTLEIQSEKPNSETVYLLMVAVLLTNIFINYMTTIYQTLDKLLMIMDI